MEIKSVIWEIKRDKFWKSKVSFEKSNASNFGNKKCVWEIKRDKLSKSKLLLEKSNATNLKSKWHNKNQKDFSFIIDKISKSQKTRKESDIVNFVCDTPRTPHLYLTLERSAIHRSKGRFLLTRQGHPTRIYFKTT